MEDVFKKTADIIASEINRSDDFAKSVMTSLRGKCINEPQLVDHINSMKAVAEAINGCSTKLTLVYLLLQLK
jgi:hypothetical protein